MTEGVTPDGADSSRGRNFKQRALDIGGAGVGAAALTLALTLPFHDSGTVRSATCPPEKGVTIVTPDQIATQQGGWAAIPEGQKICIDDISAVRSGRDQTVTEVLNPGNGTLLTRIAAQETLVGRGGNAVTVFTDSNLGQSRRGDALIGIANIGGPEGQARSTLFVDDRIQPVRS